MGDRCENCERAVAEMRAEFDRLRKEVMCRIEVIFDKTQIEAIFDKTQEAIDHVEAKSSALLADIETKNLGLLADVQRLFDTLSECLQSPLQHRNEDSPKPH
jgi:hypothetical protein